MKKECLVGLLAGLFIFVFAGIANAVLISGALWSPADASAEDPGIVPTGTANAYFTVDALNFDSDRGTTTYQTFFQCDLNTNINNLQWGLMDSGFIVDDFYTSEGKGTFFQFTGVAYFDENITITHDDGFYLTLGSTIYDYSDPVYITSTTLNNAAGNYAFVMNYGAWNDFPEVLIAPMADPVPEPATILLFGTGIAGLLIPRLRKKRT